MKTFKRFMALMLVVGMMIGVIPTSVFAAESGETSATAAESDEFYRILHLDCGRKYFTKDWIIALINEMAAVGYNQLQLAFGNDGMRFLLDDMSVTVGDTKYSSEDVTAGIKLGNKNYYDAGNNELTQSEMDAIIAHAESKGIEIVPHVNMPGHMDAILDAIEYVGIDDAHFEGYSKSTRSLNLNNNTAVSFAKELLAKYVAYFASKGCNYFHIGADEFANDAYGNAMGFPSMGSTLYTKFAAYVNDCAEIVKNAGMTPRAWNDGISYTGYSDEFDTDIQVTYWSSGWGGYNVASASALSDKGHDMINTNGDYYFILTANGITNPSDKALQFNNSAFMGSTISDPVGSMFCIWCDVPGSATEKEVAAAVRITLRKMAAAMQNTTTYSEDVVSGGFNEDGTIAETREWVTVDVQNNTGMTVSGYELTDVTVTETTIPTIEDASAVKAWDITPYVGTVPYTEKGTVELPVPEDWNTALLTGFYVENGEAVLVKGSYADGYYTFDMPHFSVAGIAELAYDELIELNVGEIKTITDPTGNYESSYTGEGLDTSVADVTVKGYKGVTETTVSSTKATVLEDGATYIVRVYDTQYALSANQGRGDWETKTLAFEWNDLTANINHLWTLEESGNGYKLKNAKGYLNLGDGNNTAYLDDNGEVFSIKATNTGWTIENQYSKYINALGGLWSYYSAGGWKEASTSFDLYKVTEATDASTEITFTGKAAGETYVTINSTVYKILVHGMVDITINYEDEDGTIVKTETVSVVDNATDYTVSSFSGDDGKFYVVENATLAIDPANEQNYTVKVTATEVDLTDVPPLTIEYWITNRSLTFDGVSAKTLTAVEAYGEAGKTVAELVPASGDGYVFWKGYLLPNDYHQSNNGDDMCTNSAGTVIQKIRYWNEQWGYYDGTSWTAIKETDQINAYYLQQTQVTDEVTTNVVDWGYTYDDWKKNRSKDAWFWGGYVENGSKFIFLDFAVVYQGGTQNPDSFPVDSTSFYHFDGKYSETNPRYLKAVTFTEDVGYEIWKITITDGTSSGYGNASTFNVEYDDTTETVVWSEEMGGEPYLNSISYTENRTGKLVRIYVRAVETDDTLKVVYYDEKFDAPLYEMPVIVDSGVTFTKNLVDATKFEDTSRIDVTNASIVNSLGVSEKFKTDLTQVPEAVGKYNSGLYTYAGSEIKDDGKILYLYYTIHTGTLSPNFVADFGLPLTFRLSQVVGDGKEELVESVTVTPETKYGTLTYDTNSAVFTYTPTSILTSIDVLTINILFDKATSADTVNVGVTPATTVYYEESFLTYGDGWDVPQRPSMTQRADVLGSSTTYGYDDAYKNSSAGSNNTVATSNTPGASAQFTFTGTGFQLYGNSKADSGFVTVYSEGKLSKLYMIDTKLSAGSTDATNKQSGGPYYSLPIISETNLPHGEYTVYIKQTNGDAPIHIDGVRIINTIDESGVTNPADSIYYEDGEDKPDFYELRDYVLNAIGVETLTESKYIADLNNDRDSRVDAVKDMAGQVYHALGDGEKAVIINNTTSFTKEQAQDLLDNGPKNELYLYPNQTLAFSFETVRVMQLGMKSPIGSAEFTLTVDNEIKELKTLSSSVDMFYKIADKSENSQKHTVSITVQNGLLSVTNLKICDDPNAAFTALTQEDMENVLLGVYGLSPVTYADAALTVDLVDYAGRKLGSVELTANGGEGETAVFTAGEIAAAAQAALPGKYALADESAITDVEVVYGESQESRVRIGKVATLNITFVDRRGRKLDSAAITVVQTSSGRCRIPASEIKSLAPKGTRTSWYAPVTMQFGRTNVSG